MWVWIAWLRWGFGAGKGFLEARCEHGVASRGKSEDLIYRAPGARIRIWVFAKLGGRYLFGTLKNKERNILRSTLGSLV